MPNALIWGAGGGIGSALAQELTREGWQVAGIARRPRADSAPLALMLEADTGDAFAVQQAVLETARELGDVDLWVYAAGDIASLRVGEMAPADWERLLTANLTGAYLTTHYSRPLLAVDAHLVYLGAVDERLRLPGLSAYAAAKAGLAAFVEALGKEERGRRVTLVRPGAVDTPLWNKMPLRLPRMALAPADVARAILQAHTSGQRGVLDL